jgi:hypothetical protein
MPKMPKPAYARPGTDPTGEEWEIIGPSLSGCLMKAGIAVGIICVIGLIALNVLFAKSEKPSAGLPTLAFLPTDTPTAPTNSPTPLPTNTITPTPTQTPTGTITPTLTPSATSTASRTSHPCATYGFEPTKSADGSISYEIGCAQVLEPGMGLARYQTMVATYATATPGATGTTTITPTGTITRRPGSVPTARSRSSGGGSRGGHPASAPFGVSGGAASSPAANAHDYGDRHRLEVASRRDAAARSTVRVRKSARVVFQADSHLDVHALAHCRDAYADL